jgi:hypothetical protein
MNTPPALPADENIPVSTPGEQEPIQNVTGLIESMLRQPRRVMYHLRQPAPGRLIFAMLAISVFCSIVYGVVVGSFSGGAQWWAAPVKISGGLVISALICLPSLYIFGCLSGSKARLMEMFGLVTGLLMLMTVLLVGFAPVAWLFSQSTDSLAWMGFLHLGFWVTATIFGLRFLCAAFAQSNARSTAGLNTWIIIFLLVAMQMSTALRPIVGKSDTFLPKQKQFFITHWLTCLDQSGTAETTSAR